jgi:hypothetical protein
MAPGTDAAIEDNEHTYTVDEALDCIGFGRFQVMMVVFAGFAWFSDAMEVMLLSFLGPSVRTPCSATQDGWVKQIREHCIALHLHGQRHVPCVGSPCTSHACLPLRAVSACCMSPAVRCVA